MVFQTGENGEKLEPIEDVMIDVDDEFSGVVIEKLSARKAELKDMGPSGAGKTRITLKAPSRSLIGYQGEFLTDTRGSGVLNRVFSHYEPLQGRHRRPPQGRAGLQLATARPPPSPCGTWRTAASCSSAPARRPTRA